MEKQVIFWTLRDLRRNYTQMSFPEYQREPNIWSKSAKQRLIDSIARDFDVSPIYLYRTDENAYDCIDGRQRIGAILSFFGLNEADDDNEFSAKAMNEIRGETNPPISEKLEVDFAELSRMAEAEADGDAARLHGQILNYRLTVVQLSGVRSPDEFNLQFARLNLGTILNSGERLHAMTGAMRNACFEGIGQHEFFEQLGIPTRRYAKEQTAAQLVAQVFSKLGGDTYTRVRTTDLQRFFKEHYTITEEQDEWLAKLEAILSKIVGGFDDLSILRNRSLSISTALLAFNEIDSESSTIDQIAEFVVEFVLRLRWQVSKGLDVDAPYRWLIDFQKHLTQASVEKPAVTARADILKRELDFWKESGRLSGDREYEDDTGRDPSFEARRT